MPEKHFYFALGALAGSGISFWIARLRIARRSTSALIQKLYAADRHWFLYFPVIIFIGGMYALVPDILHALRILPKEITRGPLFDVFFFHSTFERIENQYPLVDQWLNWFGEVSLFAIALGVMLYYVRVIKRAAQQPLSERRSTADRANPECEDHKR